MWRPYSKYTTIELIEKYNNLNKAPSLYLICLGAACIGVLWYFLRVAFWIVIIILSILLILELFSKNIFREKDLIEKELKYRKYEEQK